MWLTDSFFISILGLGLLNVLWKEKRAFKDQFTHKEHVIDKIKENRGDRLINRFREGIFGHFLNGYETCTADKRIDILP